MAHKVLYPGSFDPITNGHLDIIARAHALFGEMTILIALSADKAPLFTVQERVEMIRKVTSHLKNITVESTDGLLVDFARKHQSSVLIRGLRAVSDFDYEFALTSMNRSLNSELETVFLMTSEKVFYISSRLVKEVARHGANCRPHVPELVYEALKNKFKS